MRIRHVIPTLAVLCLPLLAFALTLHPRGITLQQAEIKEIDADNRVTVMHQSGIGKYSLKDFPTNEQAVIIKTLKLPEDRAKQSAAKPSDTKTISYSDYEELGIAELQAKAEAGDSRAQTILGFRYCHGYGMAADAAKGVEWYRKAADQGDAMGQLYLGACYYTGDGVPKDLPKAVVSIQKAANQGCAPAQSIMGNFYRDGDGAPKNMARAVEWYRKAADQGDPSGQLNLGCCYGKGAGVEKDMVKAAQWIRKAAEQDDSEAQYSMGAHYQHGLGVKKDAAKAVEWYRKAAGQGHDRAQFWLGLILLNGDGVQPDLAVGKYWMEKSAQQGNTDAKEIMSQIAQRERSNGTGNLSESDKTRIDRIVKEADDSKEALRRTLIEQGEDPNLVEDQEGMDRLIRQRLRSMGIRR